MISGWSLALALTLFVVWLLLLWATSRLVRKNGINPLRDRITLAGLMSASLAVAALLAMSLTWVSPDVSQRLGATPVRILALTLFWSTITGFILCLAGSGRMRFAGAASCVASGFVWFVLALGTGISMGPPLVRHPNRYLIPAGYVGWVKIEHGGDGPPLSLQEGVYLCRIPANGVLMTSSPLERGWAKDEYFYYEKDDSPKELANTGWGKGGMIWAGQISFDLGTGPSPPKRVTERFYVGTESEYRAAEQR